MWREWRLRDARHDGIPRFPECSRRNIRAIETFSSPSALRRTTAHAACTSTNRFCQAYATSAGAVMLYLIGLGLADETDITVKGLETVRKAARVYLEAYTSILMISKEKLVRPARNV